MIRPTDMEMRFAQGFTFIEVLVSFLLLTTISLVIFKEQWITTNLINQIETRNQALVQQENQAEHFLED